MEYNDDISYLSTQPWGMTYQQKAALQHQVGRKQYELTNHLGNVQATVSDYRFSKWLSGSGTLFGYSPALRTAYDYYPFGMLLPDRYVSDTSVNCVLQTRTRWVTKWVIECRDIYDWVWYGFTLTGSAKATAVTATSVVELDMPDPSSTIVFSHDVAAETQQEITVDVGSIATGSGVIEAIETVGGVGKVLARVSLNRTGSTTIRFTPSGTLVRLRFRSSAGVWRLTVRTVCQKVPVMEQESYLVQVCDDEGDKYRFGFNGQEKVNEWAGIGNHNTAEFWEYDTRTGRRLNLDPVDQVSISNYATLSLNPISNVDIKGDVIRPWEVKSSKKEYSFRGYSTNTKYFADEANLKSFNAAALELANSNHIFGKVYMQISRSKTEYKIEQQYRSNASYDRSTKTIAMAYRGVGENAYIPKTEVFEEVFHAGQDEYYSTRGIKRSHLENEVEAKVADIISGHQDDAVNGEYKSIKNYFKTGKKDSNFDKDLNTLIKDVDKLYNDYDNTEGKQWRKENDPAKVDKKNVLNYLETLVPETKNK